MQIQLINQLSPNTTEGSAGELILKIQWKDCGFHEEIIGTGISNNTVSFQLWLYEGSNNIEVRFGPSILPDSAVIHDFGSPIIWNNGRLFC